MERVSREERKSEYTEEPGRELSSQLRAMFIKGAQGGGETVVRVGVRGTLHKPPVAGSHRKN